MAINLTVPGKVPGRYMHFVLLELIKYGSCLAVQSIPIKKYNKPIYNITI